MLLLILLGMLAGAILAYIYREQVDSGVHDGIQQGMENYHNKSEEHWKEDIDFMQSHVRDIFFYPLF